MGFEVIDFIVIGAQKAGTTALDEYLRKHESLSMGSKKELHFFDRDHNFNGALIDYSDYHAHFKKEIQSGVLRGEVTPAYLYKKECVQRIYNYSRNLKLLAILRNPIERAFSHWNMQYNRGIECRSFSNCIIGEEDYLNTLPYPKRKKYAYLDRGFYTEQINNYLNYFDKSQMLFIKYEEYKRSQQDVLNMIFDFLDVPIKHYSFNHTSRHVGNYNYSMKPGDKKFLLSFYKNEIHQLEKLLNWDCSDWLT